MKPIKFAYILMGKGYSPKKDYAHIQNEYNDTTIIAVDNLEEACHTASQLNSEGYQCIELCGAFDEESAKAIIKASNNQIAIGYSVHFDVQNQLFDQLFS